MRATKNVNNLFHSVLGACFDEKILVNICWPPCCLNPVFGQKIGVKIGQIMNRLNGWGVFWFWGITTRYSLQMKFNVCTQPSPNDSAPSNTVLAEAADENRENAVFWPILAYFLLFSPYFTPLENAVFWVTLIWLSDSLKSLPTSKREYSGFPD